MSNGHLEYLVRVDPERVESLQEAMRQAGIEFSKMGDLVHIENIPKEPASLVFHWGWDETVDQLNEALEDALMEPLVRKNHEWTPLDARTLMEIAARNFDWFDGTNSPPALAASEAEWAETVRQDPGLFETQEAGAGPKDNITEER